MVGSVPESWPSNKQYLEVSQPSELSGENCATRQRSHGCSLEPAAPLAECGRGRGGRSAVVFFGDFTKKNLER